jgi:hypothetical protein
MKKRYVAMIVLLSMLALAGVGFLLYKYWGDITKIWGFTKTKIKDIRFPVVNPKPVTPKNPQTILEDPKVDAKFAEERAALQSATATTAKNTGAVVQKTVGIVDVESATKAAQAKPIAAIIVENTKQREAKAQSTASKAYVDLIKKIELEKAKGAIMLTAIRTETEKKKRFDDIDAEDAEMELFAENRLCDQDVRRPLSKKDAEFLVTCGVI